MAGEDDFSGQDFDSLVAQQAQPDASATQAQAPAQADLSGVNFDDLVAHAAQHPEADFTGADFDELRKHSETMGAGQVFARNAARSVLPTAGGVVGAGGGGVVGGALLGGLIGNVPGAVVGGIAGAVGGGYAVSKAQDWISDMLGIGPSAAELQGNEDHPVAAALGELAPAVAAFRPDRALAPVSRIVGGTVMGGLEAGQEYAHSGTVDPKRVAGAAAFGAVFNKPTGAGEALLGAGERLAGKAIPGRPGVTSNPATEQAHDEVDNATQAPTAAPGVATEQTPVVADVETTGNPESAPTRSDRDYGKDRAPNAPTDPGFSIGEIDPTTLAALKQGLAANSMVDESTGPPVPNKPPEENLPIDTGLEAAAAQQPATAEPKPVETPAEPQAQEVPAEPQPNPAESGADLSGTRESEPEPVQAETQAAGEQLPIKTGLEEAAAQVNAGKPKLTLKGKVNPEPSDAQIEAGNYEKAHGRFAGHDIAVETEKGGTRRSKPGAEQPWEVEMPYHYGDVKGTVGADKDPLDIGIGEGDKHFVIDQRDAESGKFDEHKIMANFKDAEDALRNYDKAFSDGKASDRVQAITPATEDEIRDWIKTGDHSKPAADQLPGETVKGPEPVITPKVVTATVNALRAKGTPESIKLAEAIEKLPVERQADEAARANAMLTNKTGKVPDKLATARIRAKPATVEGYPDITARSVADGQLKGKSLKAVESAFEKHAPPDEKIPTSNEDKIAFRARLEDALQHANDKFGGDALRYKPQDLTKHPAQVWLRQAKKFLNGTMSQKKITEFISNEKQLRSGNPEDVRNVVNSNRIDADIALSKRSGDEAVASAENSRAFDIPGEEDDVTTHVEKVTSPGDIKPAINKEIDVTTDAGRAKLLADSDVLSNNLIKSEDKGRRSQEAAALAGKKSAVEPEKIPTVRKIDIDESSVKAAMAALEKAKSRAASRAQEEPLPAEKDPTKIPEENVLKAFWNNESGALNLRKIRQDFKGQIGAIKVGMEKYFGVPMTDAGIKADAILARSVATHDMLSAHKKNLLDARWFMWKKGASTPEVMKYLSAIEEAKGKKSRDQIRDDLRAKGISADKAEWMADEARFHSALMDHIWIEDAKHGSNADYIEGYVPHIFQDAKGAANFIQQRIKSLGATWYQKERSFEMIDQAVKAGFKLKFDNPIDLIGARWSASMNSNMIVSAARALHNSGLAFPMEHAPKTIKNTWTMKRNLPDRQQWVFSPAVENLWVNALEAKGLRDMDGPIGSIYRAWMKLKTVWAPIQLAFSAFHELHIVANINPAMNIARALKLGAGKGDLLNAAKWTLTDPLLSLPIDKIPLVGSKLDTLAGNRFSNFPGRQAQHWWEQEPANRTPEGDMWAKLFAEGGISPHQAIEDRIGAKGAWADAVKDRNYLKMVPVGIRRAIEKVQEPMFKYQIPALKNIAFMRNVVAAMRLDPSLASNNDKRAVVLRELGKNVDDRYGEMFYKSLFWNKALKDAGVGSFLSLAWNVGQARQAGGVIQNVGKTLGSKAGLLRNRSPMQEARYQGGDKGTFVGSYVGLSMMTAGLLSYAMSGELPSGMDYFFPRNGQINPDGTPSRLSTPFNTREVPMLLGHAQQHNSLVGGAMEFLWNKMILSPLVEAAQNKNFYGNKLYDVNAPWYLKAAQALDSELGDHFNPISLSGADRARQQGTGKIGQVLAYSGFGPAPKYINATPMENRINSLFADEGTPYSKPYEYGAKTGLGRGMVQGLIRKAAGDPLTSEGRSSARDELQTAQRNHDPVAEQAARAKLVTEGGLSSRTASKLRNDQEFQYKFSRLPKESQEALAKDMDTPEFNRYVVTNANAGVQKATKAKLIAERKINP